MTTCSFSLQAGLLIRGQVRRMLKQYCFERGYSIDITEDKGLLGSLLMVKMSLPEDKVSEVKSDLTLWAKQFEGSN